jgi:transposase-like protein
MSYLSQSHFHDEQAAYDYVEARVWPRGPVCPHCSTSDRVGKMGGNSTRIGTYKCYACRKPFTVKIGTVFEASHVPLHLWLQAIFLICASKKGISANQLHRTLGVTLKTAWFMGHRIREAMRDSHMLPMGGPGQIVEVDETFIGRDKTRKFGAGWMHKLKVLSLVHRNGDARSFQVEHTNMKEILPIVQRHIDLETHIMTDDAGHYRALGQWYRHDVIRHEQKEYGRGEVHTNTIEGFFSIFKRGMRGVYQHCAKKHLHRYLAEFDFRYSKRVARGYDDSQRFDALLPGITGKRLTYQTTH